jgi:GT2 family glycosyltransferase
MVTQLSVTLAIPCFNAEAFIQPALDSIYRQSVAPDEILIIDDGSRDNTREIVKQFSNIHLIAHEQNRGIGASRNSGWQAAAGDVVVFMDADGVAEPDFIKKLLARYTDDNVAGVGGRGIEAVQENMYDRWRKEILFQHWGESFREDVYFLFGLCSSYRRSVLHEVGGFDPFFQTSGEDMDIGFRIRTAGYRLAYAPDAIVNHQRRDNGGSLRKMAYRHCFWGFLAQRKNRTSLNKVSVWHSIRLLMRHVLVDGLVRQSFSYAFLSVQMHCTMAKAWFDAGKSYSRKIKSGISPATQSWEGHSKLDDTSV